MKQKIIQYFNQGASTYHTAGEFQATVAQTLVPRLSNISAENILEIGCGTGYLSQHLIALFPNASLLLTDIAPAMIKTCKNNFSHYKKIKTMCIDAESMTTEPEFDLITSSMTLHWFENPMLSFKKISDKLRPGGKFIFSMLGEGSLIEWRQMCEQFQLASQKRVFPNKEAVMNYIPGLTVDVQIFQQRYANAYEFLQSLKLIGARAPDKNHYPDSAVKLRRLFRHYSNEIIMSYEVFFGSYTKP